MGGQLKNALTIGVVVTVALVLAATVMLGATYGGPFCIPFYAVGALAAYLGLVRK